jgi:hypothetical protein
MQPRRAATTGHNIANASTPGFNRQLIARAPTRRNSPAPAISARAPHRHRPAGLQTSSSASQVLTAQTGCSPSWMPTTRRSSRSTTCWPTPERRPVAGAAGLLQAACRRGRQPGVDSRRASRCSRRRRPWSARFHSAGPAPQRDPRRRRCPDRRQRHRDQLLQPASWPRSTSASSTPRRPVAAASPQRPARPARPVDRRPQQAGPRHHGDRVRRQLQRLHRQRPAAGDRQPRPSLAPRPQATEDSSRTWSASPWRGGGTAAMPESMLTGGALGGLLKFRSESLDSAQNSAGPHRAGAGGDLQRASTASGQDLTGALGATSSPRRRRR